MLIEDFPDTIRVLSDAHKKTPVGPRLDLLKQMKNITYDELRCIEPLYVSKLLPVVLDRLDDKPDVFQAALDLGNHLVSLLSVQAFPYIAEYLFAGLQENSKWRRKLGSLEILRNYIVRVDNLDRDLLSASLPELVKTLSNLVHDTKTEVAEMAIDTLKKAMRGITNRDLEPFVENLVNAIINRSETEETIQRLAGVVFVQTVEGSALSVLVPLMVAGFRQSKALVKRMCSRIVSNTTKLVEEPVEAAPFLGELIPALADTIDTIADPEARDVATKTLAELERIREKAKVAQERLKFREIETICEFIKSQESASKFSDELVYYLSVITASLIKTRTTELEEYRDELQLYFPERDEELMELLYSQAQTVIYTNETEENEDEEGGEILCDCEFTLAYGTKILLHNTKMRLRKGNKYGLLGQNDCGKTTLMRAIAEGSVDGFPDVNEVRTVFVEADIQGELSHLDCVNYVLEYPAIKSMGATTEMVRDVLKRVGFTEGKAAGAGGDCDDPISSLSGGWRMKLALARAMLQKADILLMDEPTNHLDVKNVNWVMNYINSLTDTTVIMVSHDSGLLDNCCNYILQIENMKVKLHKGNLSKFVEKCPEAKSYFEFKADKFKFTFPQPSFLEGIKSRGKFLLKMDGVSLTYPGNKVPTIRDISVRASMASRVACVGVNGAGKSTMIKVLTGELEPTTGTVWKYPNSKIGYIAQHAFHHIESHLDKTPNEYIRWRYEFGDDREGLNKASMRLSDEEEMSLLEPVEYSYKTERGEIKKERRVIQKCTGQRKEDEKRKKLFLYEVAWQGKSHESNTWYTSEDLIKFNKIYEKVVRMVDQKIANRESMFQRPLTQGNVEKHLNDTGLEPEYATHYRIGSLSGGQKVKVVLAAAMWDQPQILILDEPTNYLDRDSLGALADAIERYEGGVIMITHNDAFCRQLCPERWVLEAGLLNTEGDVDWMDSLAKATVDFVQVEEMVDASGNEVKLKTKKKLNAKEKKKMMKQIREKISNGEELDEDEENYAIEWNL